MPATGSRQTTPRPEHITAEQMASLRGEFEEFANKLHSLNLKRNKTSPRPFNRKHSRMNWLPPTNLSGLRPTDRGGNTESTHSPYGEFLASFSNDTDHIMGKLQHALLRTLCQLSRSLLHSPRLQFPPRILPISCCFHCSSPPHWESALPACDPLMLVTPIRNVTQQIHNYDYSNVDLQPICRNCATTNSINWSTPSVH